jgi:glutathione S-transferase
MLVKPVLYSFRRCPYAIRARMALYYAEVSCELREVVLKDKPQQMLAASAKGTVPVLLVNDHVIDQSLDVMAWALTQSDSNNWLQHSLQHPLITRADEYFKDQLDRYKYFDRYPEQSQHHYFEQALIYLRELETSLVSDAVTGNYYLDSPKATVLDIAIFPFVRQFAFVDKMKFDSLALPKLQCWLGVWLQSPLFNAVMNKYPQWVPEQSNSVCFGAV